MDGDLRRELAGEWMKSIGMEDGERDVESELGSWLREAA
jgi:hypothetical protein